MAYQVPGYSGAAAETHGASDTSYWGSSGVAGSGGGSGSSGNPNVALNKTRVNSAGVTEYLYEKNGKESWETTPYTGHGGTVKESNNMYAVGEDNSNVEWVNRADQQLAMDAEIVEARRKQAMARAMESSAPLGEAMGQKYYQQAGDYSEAYVGRSLPGSEYKKLAEKSLKMPITPEEAAMLREGELK